MTLGKKSGGKTSGLTSGLTKSPGSKGLQVDLRDGVHFVHGTLNEYATFDQLLSAPDPLIINWAGLQNVNSMGVRNLLKFMVGLGQRRFEYHDCPPALIDQINMVPALLGKHNNGRILSLFVPQVCSSCGTESNERVLVSELQRFGGRVSGKCSKCGGETLNQPDEYTELLARLAG